MPPERGWWSGQRNLREALPAPQAGSDEVDGPRKPIWRRQAAVLRAELAASATEKFRSALAAAPQPWTRPARPALQPACMASGRLTTKTAELLDLAILCRRREEGVSPLAVATEPNVRRAMADQFCIDVSQAIARQPWTISNLMTITTSTRLYAFGQDAYLAPQQLRPC